MDQTERVADRHVRRDAGIACDGRGQAAAARCATDSIDPRTLRGLNYLWSLRSEARNLGYSTAEIKAYVDSEAEKNRMRARGEAYMRARGLNPENNADLCTLGQAEIAKGSQIGAFLRMK